MPDTLQLTIAYDIPDDCRFAHDLMIAELVGPSAKCVSFGTLMFRIRMLDYEFDTEADLLAAIERLRPYSHLRVRR